MPTETDLGEQSKPDVVDLSMRLVSHGEFGILKIIILLSLYGGAVLSISLVLNSFFGLSTGLFVENENSVLTNLLSSTFAQASGGYTFVEAALVMGFIISCLVSGISVGRKTRGVRPIMARFRTNYGTATSAIILLVLMISFSSLALSFMISFVVSSILYYEVSFGLHIAYFIIPAFNLNYVMYLMLLTFLSFVSLLAGWSMMALKNT